MSESDSTREVRVAAPARLHFGMLSFRQPGVRQFGGLGAMIHPPELQLRVHAAQRFATIGPQAERAEAFARRLLRGLEIDPPACAIEIENALPGHSGLGSGTQLALAVAAGLLSWLGMPIPSAARLAEWMGRGGRSAVGAYGFEQGGLILEGGHGDDDASSPLVERTAIPEVWRFVLARQASLEGLSGSRERQAFAELPPVPIDVTDRLCRLATEAILPSARDARFDSFSQSLYEFGYLAGNCFAAIQGGPFHESSVAALVAKLRSWGVLGVGQSSWGPTVFALTDCEEAARDLAGRLSSEFGATLDVTIARPNNEGARIGVTMEL